MLINSTPVRTCKKFNINDFEFNEKIPTKINKFENIKISQEILKDKIISDCEYEKENLKYGTGLEDLIYDNSNQNIKININSKINKDIKIEFKFDKENKDLFENIEIIAKENCNSNIYILYRKRDFEEAFHNGLIKVFAKKNSKININIINLMNDNSNNILSIDGKIEDEAKVQYNIIDLGGKNSVTNIYSNLAGEKANNVINSIYIGKANQKIDMNYIAECFGEKSNINIDVQGALKDEAIKHFKGTIDFKKGCKKSVGNEAENCMLLSDKAKSLALPMLLCSEEDVEGNHSASSGKADEKELFYIMTRGFDRKSAEKLLVRARFNKMLDEIKNSEIRQEISYEIDQKLS